MEGYRHQFLQGILPKITNDKWAFVNEEHVSSLLLFRYKRTG